MSFLKIIKIYLLIKVMNAYNKNFFRIFYRLMNKLYDINNGYIENQKNDSKL
jgi:hypothetical protein